MSERVFWDFSFLEYSDKSKVAAWRENEEKLSSNSQLFAPASE